MLELSSLGRLDASLFKLAQEDLWVVVGSVAILGVLTLHHGLDEAGALDSLLILDRVLLDDTVGVVLHHVHLDLDFLVKANVAIVHEEALESEFSSATESLLHLELDFVAVVGLQALDLDHVVTAVVTNHDVPVRLLQEGVVLRVDVGWGLVRRQVVVLNVDADRDDIGGCHGLLAFDARFSAGGDEGHHGDHLLELSVLGLVAIEEVQLGTLLLSEAAEGLDLTIGDLVLLYLLAVCLHFSDSEAGELKHRVVRGPETLHEELLELDDGLDGFKAKLLDCLAHACELVDLHRNINHHVQVVNTVFKNLAHALLEDRVLDVRVLKDVTKDQEKWLGVHRGHVARLSLGEKLINIVILFQLLEQLKLSSAALGANCLELVGGCHDQRQILGDQVLVELGAIDSFVFKKDSALVLSRRVSKVDVNEAGNDD